MRSTPLVPLASLDLPNRGRRVACGSLATFGADVGEIFHVREATTPEVQPVIRMNQDTLYSAAILDLSQPVTVTLPALGGRYQSMHLVNQDH